MVPSALPSAFHEKAFGAKRREAILMGPGAVGVRPRITAHSEIIHLDD